MLNDKAFPLHIDDLLHFNTSAIASALPSTPNAAKSLKITADSTFKSFGESVYERETFTTNQQLESSVILFLARCDDLAEQLNELIAGGHSTSAPKSYELSPRLPHDQLAA